MPDNCSIGEPHREGGISYWDDISLDEFKLKYKLNKFVYE